jgi:hypothetical protein
MAPKSGERADAPLRPFREAALGDLAEIARFGRLVGSGPLTRDIKAVHDALRCRERNVAPYVRAALLQLAATCVEWAARLERDERLVVRRDAA